MADNEGDFDNMRYFTSRTDRNKYNFILRWIEEYKENMRRRPMLEDKDYRMSKLKKVEYYNSHDSRRRL